MNLYFVVLGAATALLGLTLLSVYGLRRMTQLQLVSESKAGGKTFYAVRLESEDFLFLKEDYSVQYVGPLGEEEVEEEEFKVLSLYDIKQDEDSNEKLKIPKHEKAS